MSFTKALPSGILVKNTRIKREDRDSLLVLELLFKELVSCPEGGVADILCAGLSCPCRSPCRNMASSAAAGPGPLPGEGHHAGSGRKTGNEQNLLGV